jgi:hypothetical protein
MSPGTILHLIKKVSTQRGGIQTTYNMDKTCRVTVLVLHAGRDEPIGNEVDALIAEALKAREEMA